MSLKIQYFSRSLLVLYFFFICSAMNAQDNADEGSTTKKEEVRADSLMNVGKFDGAAKLYMTLAKRMRSEGNQERAADYLNKTAEALYEDDNFQEAFLNAQKALTIFNAIGKGNSPGIATSYSLLADCLSGGKSDFETALSYHQKALKIRKEQLGDDDPAVANSYNNIGIIHSRLGEYKTAEGYYKKTIEIQTNSLGENHPKNASTYGNLGLNYNNMGDFEKAINAQNKSLEIAKAAYGENNPTVAYTYMNLGITYENLLEINTALQLYEKALGIMLNTIGRNHPAIAVLYANLSSLHHKKGELTKAQSYAERSLKILKGTLGEQHPKTGETLRNMGAILADMKESERAIEATQKAMKIALDVFGENHPATGSLHADLGNYYRTAGDLTKATYHNEKAMTTYSNVYGPKHPIMSAIYNALALDAKARNENNIAADYLNRALELDRQLYPEGHSTIARSYYDLGAHYLDHEAYEEATKHFESAKAELDKNKIVSKNTINESSFSRSNLYLKVYHRLAKTKLAIAVKSKNSDHIDRSLDYFENADSIIDAMRQFYGNYEDKISFSGEVQGTLHDAIEATMHAANDRQNNSLLDKAFYYAEKGKSNILNELLNESDARYFKDLPEELVAEEYELKTRRAFYNSKIAKAKEITSSNDIADYRDQLFDIDRKYDSLTSLIRLRHPDYFQLVYDNSVLSVENIQKELETGMALVEYVQADNQTYVFVLTRSNLSVKKLATTDILEDIGAFNQSITEKENVIYKNLGYKLYETLIKPIEKEIPNEELIIIPDGPLWNLNFELLLTSKVATNNPKELPYLLKKYTISYANSANVLFRENLEKVTTKNACLAFSFSDSTSLFSGKELALETLRNIGEDLPGSRNEIKAIAEIIDGRYFFGTEANERNFKSNADKYAIIHLALHGEIDNENPNNSKLYFTNAKDSIEDNFLYSHELFALKIPAALTVLSACNTGVGSIASGEGIMSLGNAFQYAGARSLVISNWEVSDKTTPEIMRWFYTYLKEGKKKSKALQMAKLKYLETASAQRAYPFYWGGFTLIGDPSSISLNDSQKLLFLLLGAVILLLALYFLLKGRKKKQYTEA